MTGEAAPNLTQMLSLASEGHESAAARLLPVVYDELRRLAQTYFGRDGHGHTLQPTALVHEAFVKLVGAEAAKGKPTWNDRSHFFAIAATAMRQILIDHARSKQAEKRGGEWQRVSFVHIEDQPSGANDVDALDLHDALLRLAEKDQRKAQVVEMRVFGGLTCAEIGQVLNVSHRTVENDWYSARAWLERELDDHHECAARA